MRAQRATEDRPTAATHVMGLCLYWCEERLAFDPLPRGKYHANRARPPLLVTLPRINSNTIPHKPHRESTPYRRDLLNHSVRVPPDADAQAILADSVEGDRPP